jgi:hypothetical protein
MSEKKQPIDDYGFKNDQIVDCLEKIIDHVWSNLHENQSKKIDTKELLELTAILSTSWSLVESMINFHGDSLVSNSSLDDELDDDSEDMDEDNLDEDEK